MKKIVLSLAALAAVSSVALADSAFDKAQKRNFVEFPDHYSQTLEGISANSYVSGDALAVEGSSWLSQNQRFAGPGEDGNQGR